MKICLMPSDFDGPGCYRVLFPARELRFNGHEAKLPPYETQEMEDGFLRIHLHTEQAPPCDIYVLQQRREEGMEKLIEKWHSEGSKVVSDTDDWYLGIPPYNPAFAKSIGYRYEYKAFDDGGYQRTRHKEQFSIQAMMRGFARSDAVTCSTPFLAEKYSRYNQNIHVLRNYLDWDMWDNLTPVYEQDRELRIGYMGKVEWHNNDLRVIGATLEPFFQKYPELKFVAAGDPEIHNVLKIPEDRRITMPSINFRDFDLADITATFDIGIVPLEMNNFNEAKSHLKGMEYAACGIPTVASPTESYRYWMSEDIGFLPKKNRTKEWYKYIELLIEDEDLRIKMGKAARKQAHEHTIQRHWKEWEDVYSAL